MPLTLKKRGKIWHVHGTVAGQRVRESTQCSRRAEAEAWATRREQEISQRHAHGIQATLTFAEAALNYMNAGGETKFLGRILEHFGEEFLAKDVNNHEIQKAAEELYPNAAPGTINRQLITPIRAVITQAAEDELTPPRKFRMRKEPPARTRWLRPAELEQLIARSEPHLKVIIASLVGSGARVSELLSADVSNFYPATGEIWLDKTKNDYPRMLKLPARARDAILAGGIPEKGALLRRPNGMPYRISEKNTPIKTAFGTARGKTDLGPEVTPHTLRHTWATWYYAATKDFGGLIDLGGWRTPSTSMRYRKIAPDDLGEQLKAAGWDFTALGRNMPAPGDPPRLRAIK